MPTEFHRRVRGVLEDAVRMEPGAREPFVREACGDRPELLEEVLSLLPHFEVMRDFEPKRPTGAVFGIPGTTTCEQAGSEARRAEPAEAERVPPFTIDGYLVESVLGHGGMGVVYRAVHPRLHRQVAIKILRRGLVLTENRQRFTFEEEVLRQLRHPYIARFVHAGIARIMPIRRPEDMDDWRPYFVMEYIDGRPLTKYVAAERLNARRRLELFAQVCGAVEYAHHRGIIHRDLKPDNILVRADGEPKILDFGIAHIPGLDATVLQDTDGQFTGTLHYASPEQLQGKVEGLTPQSDVYTLGLILHELLTTRLPRRERGRVEIRLGGITLSGDPEQPDVRDEEFRYYLTAIAATALRKTEGGRYRSAGELGADVESLLASFPEESWWGVFKQRVARFFSPDASWTPAPTSRPLRAVLHKRIAMAMESGTQRETDANHADDSPAESKKSDTTLRLDQDKTDRIKRDAT